MVRITGFHPVDRGSTPRPRIEGMPERSNGLGLGPSGLFLRGFESSFPHYISSKMISAKHANPL
jgi:hypothetical protein